MNPVEIVARLESIEADMARREPALEAAARDWHIAKRDREHAWAVAFVRAEGPVDARKAAATQETAMIGKEAEAEWEALRAVVRVLESRATIGQSLLRVVGRGA
jgi:hypothetical protein